MDNKKEKDPVIEIGNYYAIIGKDAREYKIEVLGKRVTDMETDVYVHYEGTDKRLDEWVDMKRLIPLSVPQPERGASQEGAGSESIQDSSQTSSSSLETASEGGRPKRKIVKDEVQLLLESLKSTSRKRSGEVGHENTSRGANNHHGHDHDDEEVPRVRNVEWILYAGYDIATWYYSPFPEEYQDCQRLFICEHCLKYIRQVESFMNHTKTCKRKRPPGTVVYSKGVNKIYKVDGKTNKLYCQNLSLLAKLFLDNKTLYFDIHGFHFFVLTETRPGDRADVPVGFFSKEIVSYDGYNLACILILPPFQRKSYGKLLIEFSYELTKIEGKVGSPEKPLSDLGKLGYVSYWITAILRELYPKPWPAKRVVLPATSRWRSNKTTSLKATTLDGSLQNIKEQVMAIESTTTSRGIEKPLSELKTESDGMGPMDVVVVAPVPASTTGSTSSMSTSKNKKELAFSIRELAAKTGIMEEDLLETLVTMGWMTHWLPMADQVTSTTVKNAKRGYRKLMKFDEQQRLLEKYGGQHDVGGQHQHDGHDYESVSGPAGGAGGSGLGHHSIPLRPHSQQNFGANGSGSHGSSTALQVNGIQSHQDMSQYQYQQLHQQQQQQLAQEIDPVSILEIPESDDDGTEREENGGSSLDPLRSESPLSIPTTGLKDVAVVTLEMVKDYQDRHNIRLEPYLDWNAIDWVAYRSTLDHPS